MSFDPELNDFLASVRKIVQHYGQHGASHGGDDAAKLVAALVEADVIGLARETAGLDDSLTWLAAATAEVAAAIPGIAFAVAAGYVGYRALTGAPDTEEVLAAGGARVTACTVSAPGVSGAGSFAPGEAVLATLLEPSVVVCLDVTEAGQPSGSVLRREELAPVVEQDGFTGLFEAALARVQLPATRSRWLAPAQVVSSVHDWNVLCSSVQLGIARGSLAASESYAAGRSQFGSPLTSFAAMRSTLAQMAVAVESLEALLARALDAGPGSNASHAVAAQAGRTATSVALDAIQVHGGYGYIEEYPVARQLRDAVTTAARSGSRRAALANIATDRVGTPPWEEGK